MFGLNFKKNIDKLIYESNKKKKEARALEESSSDFGMDVDSEEYQRAVRDAKKEILIENNWKPNFANEMYRRTRRTKETAENKKSLMMESFSDKKLQKKLKSDMIYFDYIFENFVDNDTTAKESYKKVLGSIFESAIELYKECDVTPRVISEALHSTELTEASMLDIYKANFNLDIKNNYTKPMLSGKIATIYESEFSDLYKRIIQEGGDITINNEDIQIYMPFEESVYRFTRSVILPKNAESQIAKFIDIEKNHEELFEGTAESMLSDLSRKVKLLASLVSPNMFNKVVDSDVDGNKMAGITIVTDKNFGDNTNETIDDIDPSYFEGDDEYTSEMEDELDAESLHDIDGDGDEDLDNDGGDDSVADEISRKLEADANAEVDAASDIQDEIDPTDTEREEPAPAVEANGEIQLPGGGSCESMELGQMNDIMDGADPEDELNSGEMNIDPDEITDEDEIEK